MSACIIKFHKIEITQPFAQCHSLLNPIWSFVSHVPSLFYFYFLYGRRRKSLSGKCRSALRIEKFLPATVVVLKSSHCHHTVIQIFHAGGAIVIVKEFKIFYGMHMFIHINLPFFSSCQYNRLNMKLSLLIIKFHRINKEKLVLWNLPIFLDCFFDPRNFIQSVTSLVIQFNSIFLPSFLILSLWGVKCLFSRGNSNIFFCEDDTKKSLTKQL